MNFRWICLTVVTLVCLSLHARVVVAQQMAVGGPDERTAGSGSTLSSAQGYGLDSRFSGTSFDVYNSGSAAMGTTTAGARAGTAGFGQSTSPGTIGTGGFGSIGGIGGLGGFGGLGGYGGLGGIGGMYGMGRNMFGGLNQQGTQSGQKVIRTRTTVGFSQPTAPASTVSAACSKVIRRVLDRGDYGSGSVSLRMEGQVAVLTGTVDTSHARDIAERLVLLEPGIGEVRNELTVRAPAPTPDSSRTGTAAGPPQ